MANEKQKVTAVKYHTLHGQEHVEGSTYDADAGDVANLVAMGFVTTAPTPAAKPAKSQPVEPMKLEETPAKQTAKPLAKLPAKRARLTAKPKGKRK